MVCVTDFFFSATMPTRLNSAVALGACSNTRAAGTDLPGAKVTRMVTFSDVLCFNFNVQLLFTCSCLKGRVFQNVPLLVLPAPLATRLPSSTSLHPCPVAVTRRSTIDDLLVFVVSLHASPRAFFAAAFTAGMVSPPAAASAPTPPSPAGAPVAPVTPAPEPFSFTSTEDLSCSLSTFKRESYISSDAFSSRLGCDDGPRTERRFSSVPAY